jgi:hypothetical protein
MLISFCLQLWNAARKRLEFRIVRRTFQEVILKNIGISFDCESVVICRDSRYRISLRPIVVFYDPITWRYEDRERLPKLKHSS